MQSHLQFVLFILNHAQMYLHQACEDKSHGKKKKDSCTVFIPWSLIKQTLGMHRCHFFQIKYKYLNVGTFQHWLPIRVLNNSKNNNNNNFNNSNFSEGCAALATPCQWCGNLIPRLQNTEQAEVKITLGIRFTFLRRIQTAESWCCCMSAVGQFVHLFIICKRCCLLLWSGSYSGK